MLCTEQLEILTSQNSEKLTLDTECLKLGCDVGRSEWVSVWALAAVG